jgi:hypothetical protein
LDFFGWTVFFTGLGEYFEEICLKFGVVVGVDKIQQFPLEFAITFKLLYLMDLLSLETNGA